MAKRKHDPFVCPAYNGTKPATRLRGRAWCGCHPTSPFPTTRRSIVRLAEAATSSFIAAFRTEIAERSPPVRSSP